MDFADMRIGNGFDVHRLVENRPCIVCGVDIPSPLGLLGHSDADVALHALADAILGAIALARSRFACAPASCGGIGGGKGLQGR